MPITQTHTRASLSIVLAFGLLLGPAIGGLQPARAADEICNGIDDDGDGQIDEDAIDAPTWYPDADADGYGDATSTGLVVCSAPPGYVADNSDHDDTNPNAHPGATEVCNGIDDDGDGQVDEGAVDLSTWYPDADADGYGDSSATGILACSAPAGYVADNSDSDDTNPNVNPGATEICDPNNVDEDSDGLADDADTGPVTGKTTWYPDVDGDGYGAGTAVLLCDGGPGLVANDTDPDDDDPNIPGSNLPPVFQATPDQTVAEGQTVQFTVTATDPDDDALAYSQVEGPGTFDPATRTFSWRPGFSSAGPHLVAFTVSDGTDTDELIVDITVTNVPGTKTTLVVTKTRRALKAAGTVSPAHPGKLVAVKLYRRSGGRWILMMRKRPALTATSAYATSFARPRAGRYKIVARFPGDGDSNPSSAIRTFRIA